LSASIAVAIILAGCSQTESEIAEASNGEIPQIKVVTPEPNETIPEQLEQEQAENLPQESEEAFIPVEAKEPVKAKTEKPKPQQRVSFHGECAAILNEFVNDDGMVDYNELRRKRLELKRLLQEFDELKPSEYGAWPREDKIAFWINVYNIQMLNVIVENYPIDASRVLTLIWGPYSIRHIKGIWTDYKIIVMDEEFTLQEIERRFFQREFNEPRAFLAITYASMSGPRLRNEPYHGYKLEKQLNDQARQFLSRANGFRIDRDEQTVYLSAIFEPTWHGDEFVKKFGINRKFKERVPGIRAVLNFISRYIPEQDVSFLEVENYTIKYIKYDWTLNDGSRR
jgi:hypothetical protein